MVEARDELKPCYNDGAHFCWTPNVQIISKVYLRRKDQPRTYALNKKDAKMVSDAAKKKL